MRFKSGTWLSRVLSLYAVFILYKLYRNLLSLTTVASNTHQQLTNIGAFNDPDGSLDLQLFQQQQQQQQIVTRSNHKERPPIVVSDGSAIKLNCFCPGVDARAAGGANERRNHFGSPQFNFCYKRPFSMSTTTVEKEQYGPKFDCNLMKYLYQLNIVGTWDEKPRAVATKPVLVFAGWSRHYAEVKKAIVSAQSNQPDHRLIFYDIGLTDEEAKIVKNACGIEYRKFDFNPWPAFIRDLENHRWKPIVFTEALKEFSRIWWFESALEWRHNVTLPTFRGHSNIQLDWLVFQDEGLVRSYEVYTEFDVTLHHSAGHNILNYTDPAIMKWFPSDLVSLSRTTMFEMSPVHISWTNDVAHNILKWFVLCALEPTCFTPDLKTIPSESCSSSSNGGKPCHRFEKSILNVLLHNKLDGDVAAYTSQKSDFATVKGVEEFDGKPQMCFVYDDYGNLIANNPSKP